MTKSDLKETFAEKHPRLNFIIGLILLGVIIVVSVLLLKWILNTLILGIISFKNYLKKFVDSTDKVIVVAMITGSVSIIGVVFSSIIAKVVDYKYNVKKYLYDKREEPYKQFIEMTYKLIDESKKSEEDKMSEKEIADMISSFSKGLTLWGSNRVIRKWLKYRESLLKGNHEEILFEMEDIIYEIRKDVGIRRRMGKGDMLAFFINDPENLNSTKK